MLWKTTSIVAAGLLIWSTSGAAPPQLSDRTLSSREGYASVAWEGDSEQFEVEVTAGDGRLWSSHRVDGTSLFLSGLVDGNYRIRVRSVGADGSASSDWSEQLELNVAHHGRNLTLTLFSIGLAVFALTVAFVLTMFQRTRLTSPDGSGGRWSC